MVGRLTPRLDFNRMLYHAFWWDALWELLREDVTVLLNYVAQSFPVTFRYTIKNLLFSLSNRN